MKPMEDDDDAMLDSLMDAMEGYDANHLAPKQAAGPGSMTVELTIHPNGKGDAIKEEPQPETTDDEAMLPTPEELEEMMKGMA